MSRHHDRLKRNLDSAERFYKDCDLANSWAVCNDVIQDAELCTSAEDVAILRARAYEMHGIIFQDWGQNEKAIHAYRAAADVLIDYPSHHAFLGRVQIDLMQICTGLGLKTDASRYLSEARLNVAGTEYEIYVKEYDFWSNLEEQSDWRVQAQMCEEKIAELEGVSRKYNRIGYRLSRQKNKKNLEDAHFRLLWGLRKKLAGLRVQFASDELAEDGFFTLGVLAETYLDEMHDYREFQHLTSGFSFLIDRPDIEFRFFLEDLVKKAFTAAQETGSNEMMGQAYFLAAIYSIRQNNLQQAMDEVLSSIAIGTNCLTQTQSLVLRSEFKVQLDERRDLALTLCVRLNDPSTAAELIESERLQTLPEHGIQLARDVQTEDFQDLLHETLASLGALSQVSVNGRSQLRDRSIPHFTPPASVVKLEEVIELVGGPDAWWWGAFVALRRVHWVVRSPAGDMWCGTKDLNDDDAGVILALDRDLRQIQSEEDSVVWSDHIHESQLFGRLGDILIPPILRSQLLSAETDTSLVVCGNWLAAIPLANLRLDPNTDVRLVEKAIIRIQPPAFLVDLVHSRRARGVRRSFPLLVSCVDPTGDLENSVHSELAAMFTLTNERHEPRGKSHATRHNLINALSSFEPGAEGIFFFSGHAAYLDVNGGLNAVLRLQDGDVLASGDWLGVFTEGRQVPCPSRVVISGCDSSGSAGAGSGEWLGLAAALLSAGARQVLATAWTIYDTPFTSAFEAQLVSRLEQEEDPAQLLAELQRDSLTKWRCAFELDPYRTPYPVIWAAFQCVGIKA